MDAGPYEKTGGSVFDGCVKQMALVDAKAILQRYLP
jgi:hypothetical protein